ncbi:MAG: TfoX/Sxy family protein [Fidelibacterota bacterium]
MAYDKQLAERIRKTLARHKGITEKHMFGGLSFMKNGKMACGALNEDLVVRVGPDEHERALSRAHARPMDFTGKPMKSMVYVSQEGCKTDKALEQWIELGVRYAATPPGARR